MSDEKNQPSVLVKDKVLPSGTVLTVKNQLSDSYVGGVRFEGDITPEKIQLAKDFESMFTQAADEVMELTAYKPKDEVLALVKDGHVTKAKMTEMKTASIGTIFNVDRKFLVKTADNKLEPVKDYVYRLERAVLDQIKIRKQVEEKALNTETFLQEKLNEAVATNQALRDKFGLLETQVKTKLPQIFGKTSKNVSKTTLWFHLRLFSRKIKDALLKIISEEKNNG